MSRVKDFAKSVARIGVATGVGVLMIWTGWVIYDNNFSQYAQDKYVFEIYREIVVSSGLTQNAIPLQIEEENVINAYTDGTNVVIYRGLINASSWDMIALVLGHELAHVNLGHVTYPELTRDVAKDGTFKQNDVKVQVAESLADKLGAFYMMKAGFDICKAREGWIMMRDKNGNYLGGDHPNYSYRFDELNINCD